MPMTISEAEKAVMPFGKFNGKTLLNIYQEDGLNYLTWVGENVDLSRYDSFKEAFEVFMNDPALEK